MKKLEASYVGMWVCPFRHKDLTYSGEGVGWMVGGGGRVELKLRRFICLQNEMDPLTDRTLDRMLCVYPGIKTTNMLGNYILRCGVWREEGW
jgi:hypothetical protein